jgi:hypothetical protein
MKTGLQGQVNVKKADTDSRKVCIYLSYAAKPFDLNDVVSAVLRAEKPDGKVMFNSCTVCEDRLEYIITTQTIAATGTVTCEITLTSNSGQILVTPRFEIIVADVIYSDSEIESTNEYTALEKAIKKVSALKDGTTFTPSVSDEGVLSWSNSDGKDNPAAVNIKGPKGDSGAKGDKGEPGKDGTDGSPGAAGADGVTPHIGDNGNWFIGNTDTGKPSRGGSTESELFIVNVQAQSGADGYTITSHNKTYEQIDAAYKAGKQVLIAFTVTNENNTFLIPLGIATETDYEFLVFANAVFYVYVDNTDTWDCYVEPLEADSIKAKISADSSAQSLSLQTILNSLVYPAVEKAHEHNNEDVLDKLSVSDGKLQYNGSDVSLKPAYYIDLAGTYPNYTCPVAMDDIKTAYNSGYNLVCRCTLGKFTATLPLFVPMPTANTWIFSGSGALLGMSFAAQSFTVAITSNGVAADQTLLNQPLNITAGDTTYSYDGRYFVDIAVKPATQLITTAEENITLADNTEYRLTDVTTLTLTYPTGNFECWMRLNFAASGNVTVTLPTGTKYIGTAPDFKNGETWELSFKDKILAAQKVGEGT